ncbi:MAG: helix-turn-helix transcriptional regulator [Roseovarius sp.]|nr:helix-turn-helix transcriptional regulator [Roseovarius sp.]
MQYELWKFHPSVNHGNIFDWHVALRDHHDDMEESPKATPTDPPVVARRLAAARNALGLSKAELADQLGIDRSSYTKIEKGSKPLLAPSAFRLYELHGIDMNYIYLGQVGGLPAKLSSKVMSHLKTDLS